MNNNIKIGSNNKLKEINIKNHTCYCFEDIANIKVLDLDNILLDERALGNILVYDVAHRTVCCKAFMCYF